MQLQTEAEAKRSCRLLLPHSRSGPLPPDQLTRPGFQSEAEDFKHEKVDSETRRGVSGKIRTKLFFFL